MSAGLPEIKDVRRIEVRPGDRFVVTFGPEFRSITVQDAETIKERAAAVLGVDPERILVIAGATLSVLSPEVQA